VQRSSSQESVDKHHEIAVSTTACYCKSILCRALFRRNNIIKANVVFPSAVIKGSLEMQHIELLRVYSNVLKNITHFWPDNLQSKVIPKVDIPLICSQQTHVKSISI